MLLPPHKQINTNTNTNTTNTSNKYPQQQLRLEGIQDGEETRA